MTTPTEGTTPRPWGFEAHSEGVQITGDPDDHERPGFITISQEWDARHWADAALIVAAVNDYDRLRAIEDAARTLMAGSVVPVADGRAVVETDRLIALREALR